MGSMRICATCAVEYDEPVPDVCPICADERQWVPADGQHWTDLDTLRAGGQRLTWTEIEVATPAAEERRDGTRRIGIVVGDWSIEPHDAITGVTDAQAEFRLLI